MLERTVRERRFEIAVVVPLTGAVLLVASAEGVLPTILAFSPVLILLGTLVMRLPLIVGIAPLIDKRAVALLAVLVAYAYGIEFVGLVTGWPYGEFRYLIDLGPMVGGVPVGLPVFFLPLVLNAYLLAILLLGTLAGQRSIRLGVTLGIVIAIDLVLDPGAVAIGFWAYLDGGGYYGVPASNYAGWLLSGTVAVVLFDLAFSRTELLDRLDDCEFMLDDLVSFVLLWGAINAFYANWIPVAVAAALTVGLVWTDRFDFDVWGRGRTLIERSSQP